MELEQFYGMNHKGARRFSQDEAHPPVTPGFGADGNDHGNPADEHYHGTSDHYPSADEHYPTSGDLKVRGVDLNEHLIRNKAATFLMRVSGDAMTGAGIFHGDVVIVDRSVKAVSGKVVIAVLNGEMLIRRLEKTFNKLRLVPETPRLSPIDIDLSGAEFSIWGVVTYVIHAL